MKTLLLFLTSTAGLVLIAFTSQAQALFPVHIAPQVLPYYSEQTYFSDWGTLKVVTLIPWWDPSLEKIASHVYTFEGEEGVWAPFQYGPAGRKILPWNHDGKAFENFVRPVNLDEHLIDYGEREKNAEQYRTNLRSGKWKEFKNGD
jgi:hypothetical protein